MEDDAEAIRYSFVIPAYNYANYIASTIESVLDQAISRCDIEVIVVDDGSTDETWGVLESKAKRDGRLRVFHQDNQGPSVARNFGATMALGEFLWFLDADDRLADGAISVFDRALNRFPDLDMLFGGYQSFHDEKQGKRNVPIDGFRKSKSIFLKSIFSELPGLCVGSSIIRRDIFSRIEFPEGVHNSEDTVMYSLVISIGRIFSVSEVVVFTRRHSASLRNNISMNVESGLKAAESLFGNEVIPREYCKYKSRFLSYRYLEMSRLYYLNGMNRQCLKMYVRGMSIYPRNIFMFSYFRKFLKAIFRSFY